MSVGWLSVKDIGTYLLVSSPVMAGAYITREPSLTEVGRHLLGTTFLFFLPDLVYSAIRYFFFFFFLRARGKESGELNWSLKSPLSTGI